MTVWEVAVVALLPAFAVPTLAAMRGSTGNRLAAVQLARALVHGPDCGRFSPFPR